MHILPRLIASVAALLPALAFTACSSEAEGSGEDTPRYAFVTNCTVPFWKIGEAGALAASEDLGVGVEVHMPPSGAVAEQRNILQDVHTRGFDGIAVSPIDPANQTSMLDELAADLHLITHDSDAPDSKRRVYVGVDNYAAGRMAGKLVEEAMPEGGKVVIFIGSLDQDNGKRRRQGVIDELLDRSDDPDRFDPQDAAFEGDRYHILPTIVDGIDPVVAKNAAEDMLNKHPDLGCMVGLFENEPPLILDAVRAAGRLDEIAIVAFDENDRTLQGIADGEIHGTIVQDPYRYGYESIRILHSLHEGDESVLPESGFLSIPARAIRKDDVERFRSELAEKLGR